MIKCRIIERTRPDGVVKYVIQQKHFLFRWLWVDAWVNSSVGAACLDSFYTLEEAEKHIVYFNGSRCKNKVVKTY